MSDEDKTADILLTWEESRERGTAVSVEELCRDCPELIDVVRDRTRLLERACWMTGTGVAPQRPRTLAERYVLESLLGTGGYAQVWRAYDLRLHRHVAVKVPRPNRTLTAIQIDEVLTEARQIARLKHVNIITLHDAVKEGAGYFLVTDLIDGETLADRLKRGPMRSADAVMLLVDVARAIDYAHRQGVVHRDLKPANIFLDHSGRPHIGDFGLARSTQELIDRSDCRGTLAYSSPEQLEGKPLDGRSDIWSLGIVLYEMIAGRPPFVDDNPVRLKQSILAAQVSDVPGASSSLTAICRRCLAAKPEERFATATELANALTHCRAGRRVRRFWRFAVPVGITALFVIGGMFLARGPASESENPNTLHVGTRQAAVYWRVTGAGATDAPAFPYGGRQQEISLTDIGGRTGQFVAGGSAEKFNGCWVATRRFTLPAEVESISLTFSNFQCDDRGVLILNGTVIGNYSVMGAGPGRLSLSPDLPDAEFHYTNAASGTVDSGFVLGGENTLSIVVNNVMWDRHQRTRPFTSPSDGTHAGVDATVIFTLPRR
jgi:tRNA A-37 threonylcarbamoyl transferase component Bud32